MFNSLKKRPPHPLRDALLGVGLAIPIAYALVYADELLAGVHRLDYTLLSNFIWLAVGVILFAWWERRKG